MTCVMDGNDLPSPAVIRSGVTVLAPPSGTAEPAEHERPKKVDSSMFQKNKHSGLTTIKETLESMAPMKGLEFYPKAGKRVNGKQVYHLGKALVYLDEKEKIIYCWSKRNKQWAMTGIDSAML